MSDEFDFATFKARALAVLQAGKPLAGKDGVLAPLLENLLNAALEGEMDARMNADEREAGNRRNGYGSAGSELIGRINRLYISSIDNPE